MTLPRRIFFTLEEAAKRWKKSEDELLQWAAVGNLRIAFYLVDKIDIKAENNPHRLGGISRTYLYMNPGDIHSILAGCSAVCFGAITTTDTTTQKGVIKEGEPIKFVLWDRDYEGTEYPTVTKDGLVILPQDVKIMEEMNPELKSGKKTSSDVNKIDRTNLRIIGAIVEILTDEKEGFFKSEAALIDRIIKEGYDDLHGISKRNLESRFKQAKDALYSKKN